jgi:hypothetical protein
MPPKPPGPLPTCQSTRIINKKSQHVERDSWLSNQTYVGWKNVGQSGKEDGSETIARIQPKKNGKALVATGRLQQPVRLHKLWYKQKPKEGDQNKMERS